MSVRDAHILDRHAYLDSAVHRLDPRAKVIATLVFIITVVSCPKYAVSALVPFVAFPIVLAVLGFVPMRLLAKRILIASPFVILIGIFNPIMDRNPALELGGVEITGGWVSFTSILLRGLLCIAAAVVLVATTSFPRIAEALGSLRVPRALVVQLMLIYRYLFLLVEEARRMNRARTLRSASSNGSLFTIVSMLSVLLMRTMDRGDAVWLAMKARGFEGEMKTAHRMKWRPTDTIYLAAVGMGCVFLRVVSVAHILGRVGLSI